MKRAELEALGLSKETVNAIMDMNGKDIEAKNKVVDGLREELKTANADLATANKALEDAGADGKELEKLRTKVKDFEAAEVKRKEEQADKQLTDRIRAVFPEGTAFASEYAENGVISDIKKLLAENDKINAKEAFEQVTKDKEGIFKNPQHQNLNLPGANNNGSGKPTTEDQSYMDKKYGNNPFYQK